MRLALFSCMGHFAILMQFFHFGVRILGLYFIKFMNVVSFWCTDLFIQTLQHFLCCFLLMNNSFGTECITFVHVVFGVRFFSSSFYQICPCFIFLCGFLDIDFITFVQVALLWFVGLSFRFWSICIHFF